LYLQFPANYKKRIDTEEILNYNQNMAKSAKPLALQHEQTLYPNWYLKQHYTIPDNPLAYLLNENEDLMHSL